MSDTETARHSNNGKPTRDLNNYINQELWNGSKKAICPSCGHHTFCLKSRDTLAKCFHPSCGFSAIAGFCQRTGFYRDFYDLLDKFFEICHQELLLQKEQKIDNAYKYLLHRGIHPEVIAQSDLGTFEYSKHGEIMRNGFDSIISKAEDRLNTLRESTEIETALKKITRKQKKERDKEIESIETETEFMKQVKENFFKVFHGGNSGDLVFFYRGKDGNIKSAKTRKPFGDSKTCRQFKPFKTVNGFFNHTLFSPDNRKETDNKIILFEGDFNTLQIQSLAKKNGLSFVHSASWGGASNLNPDELKKTGWEIIICHDNDDAGQTVIKQLQSQMTFHAFTTPGEGSDMDSFINSIPDPAEAWAKVKDLIGNRELFYWKPLTPDFARDENGKLRPGIIGKYFYGKYPSFSIRGESLFVYKNGYYQDESHFLKSEIQELVGEKEINTYIINESISYIKHCDIFSPDSINPHGKQLINLENCMLDWKNKKIYPHKPEYLSTIRIPVKYDPLAKCPNFINFMKEMIHPGDRLFVEEFIGYCLLPLTSFRKAVMLTGLPRTGKSTFLDLLQIFIGRSNCSQIPLQELADNRFKRAKLLGKLVNLFADLSGLAVRCSSYFKTIVSGDEIDAENKCGDPFFFRPFARLIFSANEIPGSSDKTEAYLDRWEYLSFNNQIPIEKADKDLLKKITTPEELSGMLNLAIDGLHRMFEQNCFTQPETSKTVKKEWQRINDPVITFVEERCLINENAKISKEELFKEYKSFCEEILNQQALSSGKFNRHIENCYPKIKEIRFEGRKRFWLGIGLITE